MSAAAVVSPRGGVVVAPLGVVGQDGVAIIHLPQGDGLRLSCENCDWQVQARSGEEFEREFYWHMWGERLP